MSELQKFWYRCKTDRRFYFQNCLKIRTMVDGRYMVAPFILNAEQEKILQAVEEQEYSGVPVRLVILKARKVGCSTLIEALGHHMCQFNEQVYAKVVAHLKESTKEIFEITRRYQDNLPDQFDIAPAKKVGYSIIWHHGSKFHVDTQGSTDSARGATPSFIHISELGLWWKRRRTTSDEDVLQAQMGSLDDSPGTYCIIESTANGASGAFYQRFWQAYKNEPGCLFRALFFGWQEHDRYRKKTSQADRALHKRMVDAYRGDEAKTFFALAEQLGYNEVWAKRSAEHNLDADQVSWAIQTLNTKFTGDLSRFDTEYPLTPQIAFTSSSESPLDQKAVVDRMEELRENPPPVETGELFQEGKAFDLAPGPDHWRVWHRPQEGHGYIISIDAAHGMKDGDFSCIQVLDQTTREQAAEYYARTPPDIVAIQAARAGHLYNQALVIPEVDGCGLAVVRTLLDLDDGVGYANLYVRRLQGNWSQRFGFRTGESGKREAAIAALAKTIRDRDWDLYSERLLSECQTFIKNARGRTEAMPGEHDDAIMAIAIAIYLDAEVYTAPQSQSVDTARKEPEKGTVDFLLSGHNPERTDPHLGTQW